MLRAAILILPLLVASCSSSDTTLAADGRTPNKAQAQAPKAALPADIVQPDDTRVKGSVIETMNAGPYTYVRLKSAQGEIWAAVNEAVLKPGQEITIGDAMWMEKFESKTLNRKFDRILFGNLVGGGASADLPPGHPSTDAASSASAGLAGLAAPPPTVVKVDKAPGPDARRVAELWAEKAALNGKVVVVRGQVVKWNPDIMGRHWLHLRDGSGSAEKQDNDITVTTNDVVAKGDIVTVRGKVAIDRDFTAGYAYPVMIEEAKVVK